MPTSSSLCWCHYFLCNKEMSNKKGKLMEIANIDLKTTWGILMRFSGYSLINSKRQARNSKQNSENVWFSM